MAGDWIKMEKATARKPEVILIAVALSIHPDEAFGICFRFWSWCDDQVSDGKIRGFTESLIDATIDRKGFAAALVSVGWLEVKNGMISITNFDRHLSHSAKTRAESAIRKKKERSKPVTKMSQKIVTSVTELSQESVTTVTENQDKNVTIEKRREENMNTDKGVQKSSATVKAQPKTEFPEELDTPEFRATWAEWIAHRIEIKKPMKPLGAKKLLKSLAEGGERKAIESINQSIANGWQGVFEVKAGSIGGQKDMFAGLRAFMEETDDEGRVFKRDGDAVSVSGSRGSKAAGDGVVSARIGFDG